MARESSAVYEPTVVVIDDGRSPSRTTKVNKACSKWGAPALALCGIAVGIIALTLVAVGATRGADANDGTLSLNPGSLLSRTSATTGNQKYAQAGRMSDQEPAAGNVYAAALPTESKETAHEHCSD
jgi:hypothetical protein